MSLRLLGGAVNVRRVALLVGTLLAIAGTISPAGAERSLEDELLDSKYKWGDYGFYLGWYDPWDAQFDQHSDFAYPVGLKVRLNWLGWLRFETDFSYYQATGEPQPFVTVFAAPEFDGVSVMLTLETPLRRSGMFRPYVGGGLALVSLSNQFVVRIPGLEDSPEALQLADWSEFDAGLQATAGLEIHFGHRAFPFVEYRHMFGELTINTITIGGFKFGPEDLLLPGGGEVPAQYDWSGPVVMAGLKIRF